MGFGGWAGCLGRFDVFFWVWFFVGCLSSFVFIPFFLGGRGGVGMNVQNGAMKRANA